MKKKNFLLLFVLSSVCCLADEPRWMNAEQRDLLYRNTEYYTGFAVTDVRAGENIEDAYNRARSQARAELVSSIRMSVHVETNTEMLNRVYGTDVMCRHWKRFTLPHGRRRAQAISPASM